MEPQGSNNTFSFYVDQYVIFDYPLLEISSPTILGYVRRHPLLIFFVVEFTSREQIILIQLYPRPLDFGVLHQIRVLFNQCRLLLVGAVVHGQHGVILGLQITH